MITPTRDDIGKQVIFKGKQNGILADIKGRICIVRFGSGEAIVDPVALDWPKARTDLQPVQGLDHPRPAEPLSRQELPATPTPPDQH